MLKLIFYNIVIKNTETSQNRQIVRKGNYKVKEDQASGVIYMGEEIIIKALNFMNARK